MTANNKSGFVLCVSLLLLLVLLLTSCGLVIGGAGRKFFKNNKDDFIQCLDTDQNGKVSRDEYMAAFDRMDKNGSGHIESTETP